MPTKHPAQLGDGFGHLTVRALVPAESGEARSDAFVNSAARALGPNSLIVTEAISINPTSKPHPAMSYRICDHARLKPSARKISQNMTNLTEAKNVASSNAPLATTETRKGSFALVIEYHHSRIPGVPQGSSCGTDCGRIAQNDSLEPELLEATVSQASY